MKSFVLSILFGIVCISGFSDDPKIPEDIWNKRGNYVSKWIEEDAYCVQIGVGDGAFSYHYLLQKNPRKLFLIDPWQYGLQKELEPDYTWEKQQAKDWHHQNVRKLFEPHINVSVIRLKSEDGVHFFSNNTVDCLYLDGVHSYEDVMRDLTLYFPKLKEGGYIIGNAYDWQGVELAVGDFINQTPNCRFVETKINHFVLEKSNSL